MDNLVYCVEVLGEYFWEKKQYGLIDRVHVSRNERGHIEGWVRALNRTVQELIIPEVSWVALKYKLQLKMGTHGTIADCYHAPDGPPLMQLLKSLAVGRWVDMTWAMWPLGGELKDLRIIVDEAWFEEH